MQRKLLIAITSHVIGWIILLSIPLLFLIQQQEERSALGLLSYPYYWLFNFSFISLFYLHAYWLFPEFYYKKKYVQYGLSVLCLFIGFLFLKPFDRLMNNNPLLGIRAHVDERRPERRPLPPPPPHWSKDIPRSSMPHMPGPPISRRTFDVVSIFLFFMLVALGVAIQIVQRLRESEKKVLVAEAEKANAELSFLKAQINPHFLFNTLNNIYSLAITGSEHTADSIMKLSNIMRYVTDEVNTDLVPLEREVACIQDYIDLQRLRLNKNVQVDFTLGGKLWQKSVPPMVLMTLVENVFKYGISNHEPAPISLKIMAEDDSITFYSQNRLFEEPRNVISTGIGLANTRQRLAHVYPDRHSLTIDQKDGFFTLYLVIQA